MGGGGRVRAAPSPRRSPRRVRADAPRGPNRRCRAAPAPPPPRAKAGRPAGAPHARFGARILALLALALIGGALYLINATFQPFQGDPTGAISVTVRAAPTPGIGKILESAGVRRRAAVRGQRHRHDAARQAAPGQVPAADRDEQRRRDRGADAGPAGEDRQDLQVHAPRGPLAAENIPAVNKAFEGDYGKADHQRARPAPGAQARRPAAPARSRASCSPRPTR